MVGDITGKFSCSIGPYYEEYAKGCFYPVVIASPGLGRTGSNINTIYGHAISSSRCVPTQVENISLSISVFPLIRLH